ncbi:hypothetical protein [Enterococcus gallinarum]|uniref:Uncharacterized protein n=1 Tax=Enterococcus gallinarum TaxID=1353 RepID=A0ABD4ZXN5_ENTGA|nr:hypothetical protein [Enterococcus gallinarum]MBF0825243.1 hypothetical protein [Enterococcus faecalis]MBF0726917.1 hypothetical protein [Enterococcus gallinarum]MBF0798888.1 hypothetical protein [Enterococcus gallinarum]MBX8979390.1 hypothetical protein [Enterococcus gallinarum]MDL4876765.1 hypothetical protein [Enterococcus gallinarum]
MNDNKKLARLETYISQEAKDKLHQMRDPGTRSYGAVIEKILYQLETADANKLLGEILSEEIVDRVIKELKEPIDILRRRTGYSDRQTKVITEMLNHMINTLQIDRIEEQVVLTNKAKTNTLSAAEKRIKEQLDHFAQQAATKREQRQAPTSGAESK